MPACARSRCDGPRAHRAASRLLFSGASSRVRWQPRWGAHYRAMMGPGIGRTREPPVEGFPNPCLTKNLGSLPLGGLSPDHSPRISPARHQALRIQGLADARAHGAPRRAPPARRASSASGRRPRMHRWGRAAHHSAGELRARRSARPTVRGTLEGSSHVPGDGIPPHAGRGRLSWRSAGPRESDLWRQ